ncbi:hypothetical protein C1H46_001346 [Malus baccata]|uniref:Uncharacterized protein n=1 Tax=Malus baccata TaxID=106549 RepID=A0A540NPK8_MALBA|nr:hypothetical protein C1H46_001346 [Malus baccata]
MNPTSFHGEGSSEIKLIRYRVNSDLTKQSLEARNKAHVVEGVIKLHQRVDQVLERFSRRGGAAMVVIEEGRLVLGIWGVASDDSNLNRRTYELRFESEDPRTPPSSDPSLSVL